MGRDCPQEKAVRQAARVGAHSAEIRKHVDECEICAESLQLGLWLSETAAAARAELELPEAASLWWRSQVIERLNRRQSRIERSTRPLLFVHLGAALALLVALLSLAVVAGGVLPGVTFGVDWSGDRGSTGVLLAALGSVSLGGLIAWWTAAELR